jgi:ABC-type sulfate transport system permease subunit
MWPWHLSELEALPIKTAAFAFAALLAILALVTLAAKTLERIPS